MRVADRLDRLPLAAFHYRLLLLSGLGWLFDSMDGGLMSFVVARLKTEWRLAPDQIAILNSAGLAGMFLGGALAGSLADRFGRKTIFQTTLLIFSVATGLCALAQGYGSLVLLRFLAGLGLGGELPVAAALVSEFARARHRGRLVVLLESFWAFGWAAAALIAEFLARRAEAAGQGFPWRIAFFIGALPALYVFVLRRALPESPRYLSARGRHREADEILRSIETAAGVAPAAAPSREDGAPGASSRRARLRDLLGPRQARRTVMLWLLWFAMSYSYYGIFTWLPTLLAGKGFPLATSFQFTLIITLAQIPGYFAAAWLVEKVGRKATLVPFMLLCALGSYFFGGARGDNDLVLWGCLLSFFNLGAWGVTYGYTPELYPTWLRGTGTGFAAAFGRIGGILAPLAVGKLMGAWGGGFAAVFVMFAAVLACGALVVLFLGEETRGRTLEEISG